MSAALYATIKAGGPVSGQKVHVGTQLIDDVAFLSSLLKYEFIFSIGGLEVNLDKTLRELNDANIVSFVDGNGNPEKENTAEERWVTLSPEERRIGRENFGMFLSCWLIERLLLFFTMAIY